MRDQTWAKIRTMVKDGKAPSIEVKAAEKVVTPKRPRGRPRVRGLNGELYNYKMHTPNGTRMRCRWFGCTVMLKANDRHIVCSEACAIQLREYCQACLDVIDGKVAPEDFPMAFRSTRVRKKMRDKGHILTRETKVEKEKKPR